MRTLEVRRHAHTEKGPRRGSGSQLSQVGVSSARRLGEMIGPFEYLLSDVPRSSETAVAMGFAVDECVPMGGAAFEAASQEVAHHVWWQMPRPFVVCGEHVEREGAIADMAHA